MIYTFYSYKGGVGSSMALANLAKWYYLRGLRVVMIDWDLEAPGGLEIFFYEQQDQLEKVRSRLGLIDMLQAYKSQFPLLPKPSGAQPPSSEKEEEGEQAELAPDEQTIEQILRKCLPPLSGMLYRVAPSPPSDETDGRALWLLPAGWRSGDRFVNYAQAVERFDWTEFYTSFEGQAYFEWLREQLEAYADVVLIDGRTGFNEMSVVCTQQMADVIVSLCAPNLQNLYGTFIMVQSFKRPEIFQARGRPLEVVVVPARIDNSELEIRNIFEVRFKDLFNNDKFTPAVFRRFQHTLWDLSIPYVPMYAYSEKLAVGDPKGAAELVKAYNDLAVHLVMLAPEEHILYKRCESDLQLVFGRRSTRWPSIASSAIRRIAVNQVQSSVTNSNVTSRDILFPKGRHTTLVESVPGASARDITNALGLITQGAVIPKAVILIVGGTSILDSELQARLFQLFSRGLSGAVLSNGALIMDGSAEGGVMTALGKALLDRSNKASLLGIANDSQITWPGRDGADGANGRKMLEPTYTHFVVVKGAGSDDQVDTLYGIAEELSRDIPVLTILVNDSPGARDEVARSVRQGWPIVIIDDSGGFAGEIQRAWRARQDSIQGYIQTLSQWKPGDPNKPKLILPFIPDPVLAEVIVQGDLHFFPITEAPEKLELYIDLRLKANDILSQAEAQRKVYGDAAKQLEGGFHRLQFWVLLLGVLITALAALKSVSGSLPFFSDDIKRLV